MRSSSASMPAGWVWTPLRLLAADEPNAITDGPFGSNLKTEHYRTEGPRVIRLQNIGDGRFVDEKAHVSEQHFHRLKKHEVKAGDLVIAVLGETLPRSCIIPSTVGPAIVKADCIRFCPNASIVSPAYLNYWLNSSGTRKSVQTRIKGVGRPRINLSQVKEVQILLPPRREQDKITATLDELFSDLDAGVAALERVRANLKRYRASVLKAAVEGRLTDKWRKDNPAVEPAAKLLQRILTERRKRWEEQQLARFAQAGKTPPKNWRDKYQEPAAPDTSNLPELPKGWCWATVRQIADIQGGIQKQPKRTPKNNAYPYLRVANVLRNRLDLREICYFELFRDELTTWRLEAGDQLIVEGNGSKTEIGRSALWGGEIQNCVHQNHIIRVRFAGGIPRFYNAYWNSPDGNARVMEQAASTSGLYTLSVAKVSVIPIPLPPLGEQEQIVAECERRLSVIEQNQHDIEAAVQRAGRLRQSILKRAFAGKLVPQDPKDEPAALLLNRIQTTQVRDGHAGRSLKRDRNSKPAQRDARA